MSGRQQGKLLEHFVAGTTARAAALLVGVQANTTIYFYQRLRQLIASKLPSYELSGEVEADECYFGGVRKGKRGRAAAGKVPVFGLFKRGGKGVCRHHPQCQIQDAPAHHPRESPAR
jgi:transposase